MTKKVVSLTKNRVTPSVSVPGDTNLSDTTVIEHSPCLKYKSCFLLRLLRVACRVPKISESIINVAMCVSQKVQPHSAFYDL